MDSHNKIPPRYTSLSFPSYRHYPKLTPHPTRDPRGHSYGKEERFEKLTFQNWKENEAYLYGIDLYNHSFWWEAHEFWEGLWQLAEKQELIGRFLQGLIQLSAALLKILQSSIKAVRSLSVKAIENLEYVLNELEDESKILFGISIKDFLDQVTNFFILFFKEKLIDKFFLYQEPHPTIFLNF